MSTELANWEEIVAAEAKQIATAAKSEGSGAISFRNGQMALGGDELPGSRLPCIVVATIKEKRYYSGMWDPDNVVPPDCYAYGNPGEGHEPLTHHPESMSRQSDECKGCPMNEWKSAGGGRPGKACRLLQSMVILPWFDGISADQIAGMETAIAKIPTTSVKNWQGYVNKELVPRSSAEWMVATMMSCEPHPKTQVMVSFEFMQPLDKDVAMAVYQRKQDALELLTRPYPAPEQAAPAAPKRRKF